MPFTVTALVSAFCGRPWYFADGPYRDGPATRLRLTSSAQHPLCITDDPRCV